MKQEKTLPIRGIKVSYDTGEYDGQPSLCIYYGNTMIGIDIPPGHMVEDMGLRFSNGATGWRPIDFDKDEKAT